MVWTARAKTCITSALHICNIMIQLFFRQISMSVLMIAYAMQMLCVTTQNPATLASVKRGSLAMEYPVKV